MSTIHEKESGVTTSEKKPIRRLLSLLLPYKTTLFGAMLAMIVTASTSSLIALLVGRLTDQGFYEKDATAIWWAPAALLAIALVHGLSTFTSSYLLQKVSQSVLFNMRMQMFESMIHWPAEVYQRRGSGSVLSKFVNEAGVALSTAAEMFSPIIRDSLQIVALSAVLLYHNWQLSLLSIVVAQ